MTYICTIKLSNKNNTMKKIHLLLLAVIVSITVNAQTTKWDFDAVHSSVNFSIEHMVISEVAGQFKKFEGSVFSDKEDFTDAKINFVISVNSINTDNDMRDTHLKSADFFDAEKFPLISFKSTSFKKIKEKNYQLIGEFTMHGVTKTITLNVVYGGNVVDPYKNTKAGFKITGTLNRKDYGLTWSKTIENGGLMVGDEVNFTCRVELAKAK